MWADCAPRLPASCTPDLPQFTRALLACGCHVLLDRAALIVELACHFATQAVRFAHDVIQLVEELLQPFRGERGTIGHVGMERYPEPRSS
jgi:hypothetical protein